MTQIRINLRATGVFFFVRFVASLLIGLIYLLLATAVQYNYVGFFGETTFNYIVGGVLSLAIGALACHYLGWLVFTLIRGWHMGALAYSRKIIKKGLPALDVGMTVLKKNCTTFAAIYGFSLAINKFIDEGCDKLWTLLEDVPYLASFKKFSNNTIVRHVSSDVLATGFDACVYYTIRYTKSGISDDLAAVPDAMRKYLYALPQVMLSSLSSFLLFYVLPKLSKWAVIIYMIVSQGFVAGILINVLLYPVFFVLQHSLFEPLETVILISAYSAHCEDEPDENLTEIVDAIVAGLGLEDIAGSVDEVKSKVAKKIKSVKKEDQGEPSEPEDKVREPVEEPELGPTRSTPPPKNRPGVPNVSGTPRGSSKQKRDFADDDDDDDILVDVSTTRRGGIASITPDAVADASLTSEEIRKPITDRLSAIAAQYSQIPASQLEEPAHSTVSTDDVLLSDDGDDLGDATELADEEIPEPVQPTVTRITAKLGGMDPSKLAAALESSAEDYDNDNIAGGSLDD